MESSKQYLRRAIEKACLKREMFTEDKVPESLASLVVFPFFGDMRSEFVFSTLFLNRFKQNNPLSYVAVCSYPGHYGLYSYVDEYWSVNDETTLVNLSKNAKDFINEKSNNIEKTLLRFFDRVIFPDDNQIKRYYNNGFQSQYLKDYKNEVLYTLPAIPSVNMSFNKEFLENKGKIIFIHPVQYIQSWNSNRIEMIYTSEQFWIKLVEKLTKDGYRVICWQNYATHDLSSEVKCAFLTESNILSVFGVMRFCDCVLDIFSGLSRYSLIARTPFLVCCERQRWKEQKEYEINDLCSQGIPKKYLFSFAHFIEGSYEVLIDNILFKLNEFLPNINKDLLPPTINLNATLNYNKVKRREIKRLGVYFFKPPKREEDYL